MSTVLGLDLFGRGRDAALAREVDEDRKVRVGMLFYTLNDVILAVFFFGTYFFLRGYNTNARFYPPGTGRGSVLEETGVMIIAVAGGVAYFIGAWALRGGLQPLFRLMMVIGTLLYLIDLAGQVWIMSHLPFTPQSGGYASSFILLAGYHVWHMAVLLFLGAGILNRAFRGRYSAQRMTGIHAIGYYWYWGAIYQVVFWAIFMVFSPA